MANMGCLLALNEQQGKSAIREFPSRAIKSASGRRLGPFRASVIAISDLDPEDEWKIPKEPSPGTSDSSENECIMDED